ncbi:MAG: polar amino acid transport system permease protein [Actinomycetota bacterium]|nr:polar amino acid transport system permease protein [Actinomycetota bacterium]MDQ1669709.1 polar amino acid transport system permease protein [Actinomycetota bacterium]
MTVPAQAVPEASRLHQERVAYRQRQATRSKLLAGTSTVLFLVVVGIATVLSPGWDRVREGFLNVQVARDSLPLVAEGFVLNLKVLAVSAVCILVVGLATATIRTLRGPVFAPLRFLAAVYTDLFRGFPLIVLILLIGFGIPGLRLQGVPTNVTVLGTFALVLTYGAYVAEVFRAGIESVHPSQRMAARSLGLTYGQTMRRVVLPQAVRRVLPPLLNDLVALQKDVGLISILGVVDAVRMAQIESARTFNYTPYLVAGLLFVLLAVPTVRLADWVNARATRRQQAGDAW